MFTVIAVVVIAAVLVWFFYFKNKQTIHKAVEAEGEVMGYEEIAQPSLQSLFSSKKEVATNKSYPIIRFRVQGAKMVRFRSQKGFKAPLPYKKGDKVLIEYEAENPLVARIKRNQLVN